MNTFLLAIDQGTTSTRSMILDAQLRVRGKVSREFRQYYPKPGWVEHDPEEIWASTLQTIRAVLEKSRIPPKRIAAIGITNQRETTIVWDRKSGKPLHRAIVWQDRRTAALCDAFKKNGHEQRVKKKTGLVLDPYFSGTKLMWLFKQDARLTRYAKKGQLAFGTVESFLTWRLTGGKSHVSDVTNASRTLLLNITTLSWDEELLKLFQVPKNILPELVSCSEVIGTTKNVPGLPDGIPIAGMAGDQQAALFGQACFAQGEAKCTYGTGSFLVLNTGSRQVASSSGMLTTIAWKRGKNVTYALEGSAFIAGAAVQWLRDELQFFKKSSEIEKLAASVSDSGGVIFVPAFVGLGCPYWKADARGALFGITRGTNRAHIARAVLEGMAFLQYDIMDAMKKDLGKPIRLLKVDGGAVANDLLMQFQADILGIQLVRPKMIETTSLGAVMFAGLGIGLWKDESEVARHWKEDCVFSPKMARRKASAHVARWHDAVLKA